MEISMTEVMRRIKLAQLESELLDIRFNIKRHEGIVNSVKITDSKFKNTSKKKILNLIKEKNRLVDLITESMFLDVEL